MYIFYTVRRVLGISLYPYVRPKNDPTTGQFFDVCFFLQCFPKFFFHFDTAFPANISVSKCRP